MTTELNFTDDEMDLKEYPESLENKDQKPTDDFVYFLSYLKENTVLKISSEDLMDLVQAGNLSSDLRQLEYSRIFKNINKKNPQVPATMTVL